MPKHIAIYRCRFQFLSENCKVVCPYIKRFHNFKKNGYFRFLMLTYFHRVPITHQTISISKLKFDFQPFISISNFRKTIFNIFDTFEV